MDELEIDTQSAIFRSKAQYQNLGDKPTKYFFNLERSRARARSINKIQSEKDGVVITGGKKILEELCRFYARLYQSRDHDNTIEIDKQQVLKIPQEIKDVLDSPFTINEFKEALDHMPNNKCPGLDGLTAEFYKRFWPLLKDKYFACIMYAIEHNKLHLSARQGLTSLLPKEDKDPLRIKNW